MSKTFASGVERERSGRPSISDETVAKVEDTMRNDRRITLDELFLLVPDVSRSTIHRILVEKFEYRKVCEIWVPRMLTEDHKRQRVDSSRDFAWDIVNHPPYSPAPSDFHLFLS
jgi:hypothetical protein